MSAPAAPIQIGLLLFNGFSMMAMASATEPLRAANRLRGQEFYRWHLLSPEGAPIRSSSGLALQTSSFLDHPPRLDRVFVVASLQIEELRDVTAHRYLQQLALHGTLLGAVSLGTFVLARAGLLNGYQCTLHWESLRQFAEEFPEIAVSRELYVRDRDRLTCAGGTAAMDLMLDQIASDHGGHLAADVAEQFLHSRIRAPQEQQRMAIHWRYGVNDARVAKAIALMEQNLEYLMSVQDIARQCNLSVRQLERLWRQLFDGSPQRFYMEVRLAEARRLLKESTQSIASIAMRCGFASASHLSSAYRNIHGHSPGEERRKSDRFDGATVLEK
ncbi:MAG: GlxA family transcriptional regulator [Burkholderiaceae bacterium]